MGDHHAIATFTASHFGDKVLNAVPDAFDHAGRRSKNLNARLHGCARGEGDVSAVMRVIRQRAAGVIGRTWASVVIGILLDVAGLPQNAGGRPSQFKGPRRLGEGQSQKGQPKDHFAISSGGF